VQTREDVGWLEPGPVGRAVRLSRTGGGGSRAGTRRQDGLKKNSIFTPASSMMSWSDSRCAWASSVLPLTTG